MPERSGLLVGPEPTAHLPKILELDLSRRDAIGLAARGLGAALALRFLTACGGAMGGTPPTAVPTINGTERTTSPIQTAEATPTPGPGDYLSQSVPHQFPGPNQETLAFIYFTRVPDALGPNVRDGQRVVSGQGARQPSPGGKLAGIGMFHPFTNELVRGATVSLILNKRNGTTEEVPLVEAQNVGGGQADPKSDVYENNIADLGDALTATARIIIGGKEQRVQIFHNS